MSMVITTNRGGICGICLEQFDTRDQQFTHVQGNHDGFHKRCLAQWVATTPVCPYDREAIDPNSLIFRTDRLMARCRSALVHSAYATFFGIGVVLTAAAVAAIETGVEIEAGAITEVVARITGVIAGAIVGSGINLILSQREVDPIVRQNIGIGMSLGLAALVPGRTLTPLRVIATTSLGGAVAGVLSVIRR